MNSALQLKVTFTPSTYRVDELETFDFTWSELVRALSNNHTITNDKTEVMMFTTADIHTTRCADNVAAYYAVMVDIDNGCTVDEFQERYSALEFILYTSHSHREDHHKFRAVFPLAEPIDGKTWSDRRASLKILFPMADPAGFNTSQVFYMPSCPIGGMVRTFHNSGNCITSSDIPSVLAVSQRFTPSVALPRKDDAALRDLVLTKLGEHQANEYGKGYFVLLAALYNEGFSIDDAMSVSTERIARKGYATVHSEVNKHWQRFETRRPLGNMGTLINWIRNFEPEFLVSRAKRIAKQIDVASLVPKKI